ncbi:MAG: ParB N-terminal domain-containing protein [Phycisphaerae bacterium]
MKTELRPLAEIKPYESNPRVNDTAVDAVAKSIREFGFRQPIVVDGDSVIVVGHTRWKAAQRLGMAEVPVHVAGELSPEQCKAYRIADNKPEHCRSHAPRTSTAMVAFRITPAPHIRDTRPIRSPSDCTRRIGSGWGVGGSRGTRGTR